MDLNGNVQFVGTLSSQGAAVNTGIAGGSITSSTGTGILAASSSAASFGGVISGTSVGFLRSGTGLLSLLAPQTYGGATIFNGGGLTSGTTVAGVALSDYGSLLSTSSITLNFTSLNINNTSTTLADSSTRLSPTTPIFMNGGGLNFYGRSATLSRQTVGDVTLQSGNSIISSADQSNLGTVPATAILTLSSLTRTTGSGATVVFAQPYQNNSSGTFGVVTDTSGRSQNIMIASAPALTNNIIGGWAMVTTGYFPTTALEYASYNTSGGVGSLGTAGFAGYDATALPGTSSDLSMQNIRLASTTTTLSAVIPSGGLSLNSLNMSVLFANATASGGGIALSFANDADTLTLTSGGLATTIIQTNSSAAVANTMVGMIGATVNSGRLTSAFGNGTGVNDLYLHYHNGTAANGLTINSKIVDNGTTPVRLVTFSGVYGASTVVLAGSNTYTGGTVVNTQSLTIAATGYLPAPLAGAGLTINNGTVTSIAGDNLIAEQSVQLNGGATLNLTGTANTLSSITFNNNGGAVANISNAGSLLTLTGDITASSNNLVGPATITAGNIEIGSGVRTITVNPVTFDGTALGTVVSPYTATLNIGAVLLSSSGTGSIRKAAGILQLSGANTFDGGVDLQGGGLYVTNAAALGSGALTISGNNTSLTGTALTLANDVVWVQVRPTSRSATTAARH